MEEAETRQRVDEGHAYRQRGDRKEGQRIKALTLSLPGVYVRRTWCSALADTRRVARVHPLIVQTMLHIAVHNERARSIRAPARVCMYVYVRPLTVLVIMSTQIMRADRRSMCAYPPERKKRHRDEPARTRRARMEREKERRKMGIEDKKKN